MTKTIIAALALAALATEASAQQRTFYDASEHCGEARCEADVVGAVEPADDSGADVPHAGS